MKDILKCDKCNLCNNQPPLLDNCKDNADVFWVGLSAKKVKSEMFSYPLASDTNSGKLILEIEKMLPKVIFYKTNIVKCLPLSDNNKLRYPTNSEIYSCIPNLIKEIEVLKPKIIFLLGKLVANSFNDYIKRSNLTFNECKILEIKHPSYICVYKKGELNNYKNEIIEFIGDFL